MFSPGNISEKLRVAGFECQGETVLDMYAGIGYFTLPLLLHAHAHRLIACEWNPWSLQGLCQSLNHHRITYTRSPALFWTPPETYRVCVLEGDNQVFRDEVRSRVDRVHLGLLPDCREGLPMAVSALKETSGGVLHVHENVMVGQEEEWIRTIVQLIHQELQVLQRVDWTVHVMHTENVKSFAPRIYHWVADVHVRPPK
jgi:tRNA wybutosine-synthesizing protein 3